MNSEGVKRTLDRLAYASLILDICIAAVTGLTILDVQFSRRLLLPVDYVLSAVVVLALSLFVVLFVMKSVEKRNTGEEKRGSGPVQ